MNAADREASATYRCGDVTIAAYVAAYINQDQGRELVSVGNVLVPPRWIDAGARQDGDLKGTPVNVVAMPEGTSDLYAVYGYDVNGRAARSVYAEKILEMRAALSLRPVVARAYLVNATAPRESTEAMRARVSELAGAILAGADTK
jgi:hypothetical protein